MLKPPTQRSSAWRLRLRTVIQALLVLLAPTPALAHDFWIQPSTFRCAVNAPVKVELHVGTSFPGEIVARNDSRTEKFIVTAASADGATAPAEKPIVGRDGDRTAGGFRPATPGLHILAYRSKPSFIK